MAQPALDAISGTIRPGVITGLAGPDGAGKTTLIRIMAGLLVPDTGTVAVFGSNPVTASTTLRDRIGYMPQKFGLYEDLSVMENLDLHAALRGVVGKAKMQRCEELLSFTALDRFTSRLAGKLSGGMKQKLGLACALLGTPDLLLLDEPGVGVDPISRRELWKMVRELTDQGIAVVWSTSYLDEAEACDDVLLLNQGAPLFHGIPADLTKGLAGRCHHLRGVDGRLRQSLTVLLRQPEVCDATIQGQSLRIVLQSNSPLPDPAQLGIPGSPEWIPVAPRFEDAFIDLLGGGPGGESALAQAMPARAPYPAPLIVAEHLTKMFGTFAATDDVSFSVHQGEIFGLLGPNGAGKSTTFKMMCGLLRPSSGKAEVLGIDLRRSPAQARQRLGYMAQKFSLYGKLSVRQNLDFFSGAYGLSGVTQRQAVDAMIQAFHLEPLLSSRTDDLSLGYKQRIALACATMHAPEILFLDEPTSGVDPITRREFWNHINAMVEKGVTIMVTTHFMDEAEYCDRIGLVYQGRLIALAPPDDLKRQTSTAAVPDPTMEDAFIELIYRQEQA